MLIKGRFPCILIQLLCIAVCVGFLPAHSAEIQGGKLHMNPGENEDSEQSNQFVKVIVGRDGSVQVFYHDPDSGNNMVKKTVPGGGSLKISYWDLHGHRLNQIVKSRCGGGQEAISDSTPVTRNTSSAGKAKSPAEHKPELDLAPGLTPTPEPIRDTAPPAEKASPSTEMQAMAMPGMDQASTPKPSTEASKPATPSGENYVSECNTSIGICCWKRFPIKVFMPQAPVSYHLQLETDVKEGMDAWSKATDGKLSFKFVGSASEADMVIGWAASNAGLINPTEAGEANIDYRSEGNERRTVKTPGEIYHAKITYVTRDINNQPWPPGELKAVVVHETGHALGLIGHSKNSGDIMYFKKNYVSEPSARDITTLNMLYETVFSAPESK